MRRALVLLAGIAIALLAQSQLDRDAWALGLSIAALAIVVSGIASRGLGLETEPLPVDAGPQPHTPLAWRRRIALAAAVVLAIAGVALMRDNSFTVFGTLAWASGVVIACAALDDRPADMAPPVPAGALTWLALAAIVVVAALLRFRELVDLPAEAGCDIPLKLEVVRGMLAGERPIYSPVFPGREVGFFYLTALYGALFGADQKALKVVSASLSLLTVAALYGLGARWFGRLIGLLAAAGLALSAWHVTMSRVGYRAVLTPLMVVSALWALDRCLTRGARRDWLVLGAILGVCGYTYTAAWFVPLAVVGFWLVAAVRSPAARRGVWVAGLLAVLVGLPMVRVAVTDFPLLSQRALGRTPPEYDLGERLLDNAGRSLGMFNLRGDEINSLNVAFRRMLGWASGALFLCGVGIVVSHWRQRRIALLLWFLLAMQLPSALVLGFPNEVPGALHASGTLIPVYLFAALPLAMLWNALRAGAVLQPQRRAVAALAMLAGAFIAIELRDTWQRYFVDYRAGLSFGNYPLSRTIAQVMDAYAGRGPVYLPSYPYWIDGKALRAQLARLPLVELHEIDVARFDAQVLSAAPPLLIVLRGGDEARLAALRAVFPRAELQPYADAKGEVMFEAFYASAPDPLFEKRGQAGFSQ